MKKLLQENGPDQLWMQLPEIPGEESAEPIVFTDSDDWSSQLFNYYFLAAFGTDSEGSIDTEHPGAAAFQQAAEMYFSGGGLSEIHARQSSIWFSDEARNDEDGVWFTAAWQDFQLEEEVGPAIGFFFARDAAGFLHINGGEAAILRGLPMKKPEFACLLFQAGVGRFRMFQFSPQPGFWSKDLFPWKQYTDDAFHSREFFKLCKSFSEDVLVKEQKKPREEQVEFLSDSLSFTNERKAVSFDAFKQEVLKEPTLIDAFDQYKEDYSDRKQWNPPDQFAVSDSSQNQAKKFVKSVIKLDKNFHIYVHGNRERIEKGFDQEKRLHYYTLWFEAEA
jgi:hypothetical protein